MTAVFDAQDVLKLRTLLVFMPELRRSLSLWLRSSNRRYMLRKMGMKLMEKALWV